jgi:sugar phosphate isomerase/epimerase
MTEESAPALMRELAELGFTGVEGVAPGFTDAEFRKFMGDLGVEISSIFGPIPTPENLQEIIDRCGVLGTRLLTGGFWIPDLETRDMVLASADKLAWGVPELKKHGIEYCLHNHWMEFEDRGGDRVIDLILSRVPDLQLELDIYWASNFGALNAAEVTRQYADKVRLMHVKDGPLVKDQAHLPLGQGKIPVEECIHAANPAWLVLELDEYDGPMMDAVRESMKFLKRTGIAA